jgi:uncharacterized membrane protein YdjX (TVP38/TMEM64 family)
MRRILVWVAAGSFGLVIVGLAGRVAGEPLLELVRGLGGGGVAPAAIFITVYILATVALVPGSLLTLAAGALFGLVRGTLYVLAGATVGASIAFLIARYLARPVVERRFAGDERFARLDRAVEREGGKIVLLLRLTPVIPFNLLNYGLGVTGVRFRDYVVASVGMLPGTVLYVYSGRVIGEITAIAAGTGVQRGPGSWVVLLLGLIATVALVVVITRIARRALSEEEGIDAGETRSVGPSNIDPTPREA